MLTKDQLFQIVPTKKELIDKYYQPLVDTMVKYEINTMPRIAAFIAQLAHESGSFRYVKEIASGQAYEGRADLGNNLAGDGVRFKGRGFIQVTGRGNYTSVNKDLGIDCVNHPELLESPENACLTGGWYWNKKKLNILADKKDFITITKRITAGLTGLDDRSRFYIKALDVLK